MKYDSPQDAQWIVESPPSRGAWIEISIVAWIIYDVPSSPPSRGAWIEMSATCWKTPIIAVAPLAGGVD